MTDAAPLTGAAASARASVAIAEAKLLTTRSRTAIRGSSVRQRASDGLRHRALRSRAASRRHRRIFSVEGRVEDRLVLGVLRDDGLILTAGLLERAQLLVSMGEEFTDDDGPPRRASLDGPPTSVLLTLIRACDQALAVELGPAAL